MQFRNRQVPSDRRSCRNRHEANKTGNIFQKFTVFGCLGHISLLLRWGADILAHAVVLVRNKRENQRLLFIYTYFADSFQQAYGKDCCKASDRCEYGSQQCQQCGPEDAGEHQQLSAGPLCQHPADDVRHRIAVEEGTENEALSFHVPVEDHARLSTWYSQWHSVLLWGPRSRI